MTSRYLRRMVCGRRLVLFGTIIVMSGCGQSAQVLTQQQEIAYQTKIALINNRLARSPADAGHTLRELQRAIKQYERIEPPFPLRRLHAELVDGLRKELAALRSATSVAASAATIHAAVLSDARGRSAVNRTLARMIALIGACRADAARC